MNKILSGTITSLLALLLSAPAGWAADARLNHRAQAAIAANPSGKVKLILTYNQPPGLSDENKINGNGGLIKKKFIRSIRGHAIEMPAQAAEALLANNPNIARASLDERVAGKLSYPTADGQFTLTAASYPVTTSVPSSVRAGQPELAYVSYTGANVRVAVLDSGFKAHGDLAPLGAFAITGTKVDDTYGHGNHVAAIVGGTGSKSGGLYAGVAPGAKVYAVRVLDQAGQGLTSDVIAGLDEVLAKNQSSWNIRVLNLSLGHPVVEAAAVDPLVQAVEAIWDSGVVVVCSAGNAGRDGYGTITSPGNSRKVITVGSLTTWGDADPANDIVSTFSSRGPTRIDRVVKPDLVAHGNRVISINAASSYLTTQQSANLIKAPAASKAEYYQLSGTSMAAAVVTGAVALMLEKNRA